MATKNSPGNFDCYANAAPDEPMFILLGRDPVAPLLIDLWRTLRAQLGGSSKEQLDESGACARACEEWARKLGKAEKLANVDEIWKRLEMDDWLRGAPR